MKPKIKLRHYVEAILLNALPLSLKPLPFWWRVRVGGAIMAGAIRLIPPLRKRITNNLALIYPNMAQPAQKALLKRITRHIGRGFIQIFYTRDYHAQTHNIHCDPSTFSEVREAQKTGRPVIFATGHIGQWEAVRVKLMQEGLVPSGIYKPASNPIFEKRFVSEMTYGGTKLFPVGLQGMRPMMQHLRGGGIVTVLLDQRIDDGAVLDFMGHPALTSTAMAAVAVKTNALMIPAYAIVMEDGSVDIRMEPSIPHGPPEEMLQAVNDSLSRQVRAHPEQWYWLHKRWARPDLQP